MFRSCSASHVESSGPTFHRLGGLTALALLTLMVLAPGAAARARPQEPAYDPGLEPPEPKAATQDEYAQTWHTLGSEAFAHWGGSMERVGDVNGDGFDDMLMHDHETLLTYYGTRRGLQGTPGWTTTMPSMEGAGPVAEGGQILPVEFLPRGAGDINGDGFGDVVVGVWYNLPERASEILIYTGSSAGLSPQPTQTFGLPDGRRRGRCAGRGGRS